MPETTPQPEEPRRRPTPWAHPVDERGRAARARRARRRRWVLVVLALAVATSAILYYYLTSEERVEQFAETYLENLLGTHVSIGRAAFTLDRGLVLEDLSVRAPAPFREPLLTAAQVTLKVDPLSLMRLSPEVSEIVVERPAITLVLWNGQEWNFQSLIRQRPAGARPPGVRPVVALEEGTLRILRKQDGRSEYAHHMQVSGLLLPSEADPRRFRFQTDVRSREVHLAVASGTLDARTGALRFEGHASNVALSRRLYQSLPSEVQTIWDRFDPKGTINAKLAFDERTGFRLVAELTGVTFAYPYGGLTHRFENLTGRCRFEPSRLRLEGVQGLVNGWPVTLEGEVSGFDRERLALDLDVSADHVNVEKSRPLLVSLAPHVERLFEAYSPKGLADIDLRIGRRPERGARLEVSGALTCREMEMTHRLFPYRVRGLRGTVHFSPDGYRTDRVEGRHGPATVEVAGWSRRRGEARETRVTVHATNVPLDEQLRQALSERQRDVYDLYAPKGVADIDVVIHRLPEPDADRRVTVNLHLRRGEFRYANFPYRLRDARGEVVIAPGRTEIVTLQGRHGEATVTLKGELVDRPDGTSDLTLHVAGTDVALDEDLEAALPERQRETLKAFHLSGRADIEGTVTRGPETGGQLDYDLAIRLNGARMVYEPFPFLAEEVTGELRLERGSCRIGSLTGFNSGARIEATGWIDHRPDDWAMDLTLTGSGVALGESLRGALGPEMRSAWSHLSPRGRVDVTAHLQKDFGQPDADVRHHVWVTLHDAQARLDVFPYPLEHVTGQIEFEGSEVRLHDIEARSGLTRFDIGGRIGYEGEGPRLRLAIRATGLRFEGPLRRALPRPLKRAYDMLKPTGRVDLDLARLVYRGDGEGGGRAEWYGTAILDEVDLEPGLRLSGLVGTAEEVVGRWTDGRVALDGRVHIQQGEVAGKNIRDTRLRLHKTEEARAVAVDGIEGEFYGGRIEGRAGIGLGPKRRYSLDVSAVDIDFERLLREAFRLEHNISGGRLRGTMALRAAEGRVEASGFLSVTDAELYELPLVVRLINVFRLAPAERTAFQKARVLYFLKGKRLYLGDIRLEGRALDLYGAGTMEPDGRLNLTFMTGKKDEDPLLPALSELMEGLRKQVVVVQVGGTLAEPEVEFRTLSAVTEPIREVIRLVQDRRRRRDEAR